MGRDKRNESRRERVVVLTHDLLDSDAWKALSPAAWCVYICLRREWRGASANNNGKIRISRRQIRAQTNLSLNTIGSAVDDLQRKGVVVIQTLGHLGIEGFGKSPEYRLTEIPMPGERTGDRRYRQWERGSDFEVKKSPANNPSGRTQRKTLSQK